MQEKAPLTFERVPQARLAASARAISCGDRESAPRRSRLCKSAQPLPASLRVVGCCCCPRCLGSSPHVGTLACLAAPSSLPSCAGRAAASSTALRSSLSRPSSSEARARSLAAAASAAARACERVLGVKTARCQAMLRPLLGRGTHRPLRLCLPQPLLLEGSETRLRERTRLSASARRNAAPPSRPRAPARAPRPPLPSPAPPAPPRAASTAPPASRAPPAPAARRPSPPPRPPSPPPPPTPAVEPPPPAAPTGHHGRIACRGHAVNASASCCA